MKTDAALCAHYQRLCDGGTKPNLAKLTIARKSAAITLAVWKKGIVSINGFLPQASPIVS